ncbi:LysM domain protein [Leptodontidium sp. MPI-SDFR-AT-0119]|nr:LysM domain protein [Leptodontidium sp. MPI-SDFR-AT-0119]
MKFSILAAAALAAPFTSGYLVAPPGVAAPLSISTCSAWHDVVATDTCASIIATYGITLAQFILYNPIAGSTTSCTLLTGFDFCVQINYGVTTISTSTSTSTSTSSSTTSSSSSVLTTATTLSTSTTVASTTTTTSTGNGISTPTPYQVGITTSCGSFYLVVSGDQCGTIATAAGISLDSFYAWNPAVGSTCASLWAGYYVCINVIGGSTSTSTSTTTTSVTTTSSTNGIATPTPYQSGMTTSCNTFYLVVSGDQCGTIATAKGISLSSFYAWNPAVGSTCASLWADYYVCVNVIGGTTSTTSTTTSVSTTTTTGNGVTTPTPVEPGITTTCSKFHLVVSGDTCAAIATAAGITTTQFYAWNTNVGSTCASLWLGYYVCIGVL